MRIRYGGLAAATMLTMAATAALPTVTNIGLSQNDDTRLVTITYTLTGDTPAIVTADILTNGVSVGAVSALSGDINKMITPTGGTYTAYWQPRIDLPGVVLDPSTVTAKLTVWDRAAPPDYMAVDLTVSNSRSFYPNAESVPFGVTNRRYKTDVLLMRKIPAAGREFLMGSSTNLSPYSTVELGRKTQEFRLHPVVFTNDFYIGVFELTYRQFRLVTDVMPDWYFAKDDNIDFRREVDVDVRPITDFRYHQLRVKSESSIPAQADYDIYWPVSGHQIVEGTGAYFEAFRKLTGLEIDCPTEAQWEYACRAGSPTSLYTWENITNIVVSENLDGIAWYAGNWDKDPNAITSSSGTKQAHEVGLLKPNAFGLYDMLGNVYEYCLDNMSATPETAYGTYNTSEVTEPVGGSTSVGITARRAVRGGSFNAAAGSIRAGYRISVNTSSTYIPASMDAYMLEANGGLGDMASNSGVRLACPAVIPLPATVLEGE